MNPRAIAAKVLTQLIHRRRSLTHLFSTLTAENSSITELGLVKELCYGISRWYFLLNALLELLLPKPLKEKDHDIHALLLIGLYQILYLRTPDHVAVTETVNAARHLKKPWATRLINAILRNFLRNKKTLLEKIEACDDIKYSHPLWLINMIKHAWPNEWQETLVANNEHPPLCLRVNTQRIQRDAYLTDLNEHSITATSIPGLPQSIVLEVPQDITQLPGFSNGYFSVQDGAAQLAAELLALAPNQRVLDACAAPGGKTTHMAEHQPHLKQIVAIDSDTHRLKKAMQNWGRLKLVTPIEWIVADTKETTLWWDNTCFDRILLDAPCSGTGVIRRHPDIKLLRRHEDINTLANEQFNLLQALWPLLKEGGILVYATCSILPEENEQVITRFLQQHRYAKELKIISSWGINTQVGIQILPHSNIGMDGFYYARILKT